MALPAPCQLSSARSGYVSVAGSKSIARYIADGIGIALA